TLVVVPLAESDPNKLIERCSQARAAGADAVEVRLDLALKAGGSAEAIFSSFAWLSLPIIVTIRHASEQGAWKGDEGARLHLYARADTAGAAWVDRELAHHTVRPWRPTRAKLILSHHDFTGMGKDLPAVVSAMRAARADLCKIAVTATDAADLDRVRQLIDGKGPVAAMAMGEHGVPSRLLAGVWNSALTFARLPGDAGSAVGQPAIDELISLYRIKQQTTATKVYGVIGSPIAHSLSPLVHNAAFSAHKINAVYVPFLVTNAPAFWKTCGDWIQGLSITIPHKQALQALVGSQDDLGKRIGAMNTIYRNGTATVGANTDADAIRRCSERALCGELRGKKALVLGAGGAGRAAVCALQDAGAEVAVANRTLTRAEELARELGGLRLVAWEALAKERFDLLVNMTSVGLKAPTETPWPHKLPESSAVFDSVYNPLETKLIVDAKAAGCRVVPGLDMFLDQACAQFKLWTNHEAPADVMRALCVQRLTKS
ncbi:MAG: type I 3-dehydroquinate dehydratase, partial [Planctomycetota bacterium]